MKKLPSVSIGEQSIELQVEEKGEDLLFTATCGEHYLQNKMVMHGEHTYTAEQFQKDVREHAERLARELAGKINSKELRRSLFAES